ncbi:L-threonylcarbamoyladenylate synthase [Francisella halioticida]|nr:Sua5/YciO/YrdC/YwlC family protein [Francisella halioticida]
MGTDKVGLEKKFQVKKRNKNKPGVVLCSSIEQLTSLAEMTPEILSFYQKHWQDDILLGCILPWKEEAKKLIPEESKDFIMDKRSTSCFVIKFGKPSEQIASQLWEKHRKLCFASSANPSGKGNKGMISGVGYDIEEGADLLICADDYVASIQPGKSVDTRYEQGVMVSMVDNEGNLIPHQNCQRKISPCPIVIRKGLDIDKIMINLSDYFLSWDYRQGTYY